jgi:hypothetical protein
VNEADEALLRAWELLMESSTPDVEAELEPLLLVLVEAR